MARKKHALSTLELAAFLRQHCTDILDEWTRMIARDPKTPEGFRVGDLRMVDGLESVLACLISHLDRSCDIGTARSPVNLDTATHAEHRFEEGYSVFFLMQELGYLREATLSILQHKRIRLQTDATHAFHRALDQCMSQEAEAMQRKEAALRDNHTAAVSHDLRTLLMVIKLCCSNLLANASLKEGHLHTMQRLLRSADLMDRMINDLLTLYQVRQGVRMKLVRSRTSLLSLCTAVIQEVEGAYPDRAVQVLDLGKGVSGDWDEGLLLRAIMNLVVNAVQHGERSEPIRITINAKEETGILSVTNKGPPIPPDLIDTIFDPFSRGHPEDRPREAARGMGLGLWIVREIIRAHLGSVTVQSNAEDGTVFTIRLPRSCP